MTDAAAFKATYSDWRLVKGRKVVQVVLEVPLEKSALVFEVLGGMPNVAAEVWVGVARLDRKVGFSSDFSVTQEGAASSFRDTQIKPGGLPSVGTPAPVGNTTTQVRALSQELYRRVCLPPSGRLFQEKHFQYELRGRKLNTPEEAKQNLKRVLGIDPNMGSLSEVDTNPVLSERAEEILGLFGGWERGL